MELLSSSSSSENEGKIIIVTILILLMLLCCLLKDDVIICLQGLQVLEDTLTALPGADLVLDTQPCALPFTQKIELLLILKSNVFK